jgi:hypothetical protein
MFVSMKGERRLPVLVLVALAIGLVLPGAARATLTIGSNLQHTTFASTSCLPNCTAVLGDLSPEAQAPGGVSSPVNGTVTTWRLGVGNQSGPTSFRIVRRLPDGTYKGGGTSAMVTPALETENVFSTNLPIRRGELIGIDCCAAPGVTYFTGNHTGQRVFFEPGFLGDGAAGAMPSGTDTFEILLNADIEPTSAFTVGKAKQKKGGTITMIAQLPNPGTLIAEGTKTKPRLLKPITTEAGPGPVTVGLATTKAARALVADRGRLTVKVKLTFTPTGGSPAVRTLRVNLRGPR